MDVIYVSSFVKFERGMNSCNSPWNSSRLVHKGITIISIPISMSMSMTTTISMFISKRI